MSLRSLGTPTKKYSPRLLKQIDRVNKLRGTPETSYKFDASKIKEVELFVYRQKPIVFQPAKGLKSFLKDSLPTLRYHNPDIQFTVTNIKAELEDELKKIPLKLNIKAHNESDSSSIECANQPPHWILSELVKRTKARQMTAEEIPLIEHTYKVKKW